MSVTQIVTYAFQVFDSVYMSLIVTGFQRGDTFLNPHISVDRTSNNASADELMAHQFSRCLFVFETLQELPDVRMMGVDGVVEPKMPTLAIVVCS